MLAIIIVSFLLEAIISNFVPIHGFFAPLLTLTALITICPLFDEKTKYYKYAFITGLMYDLFYTNTICFHAIIFCLMAYIVLRLNLVLSDNYANEIIIMALCIIMYRVITYCILALIGNVSFDFIELFLSIIKSLIINLAYSALIFSIIKKFKPKTRY